MPTAGPGRNVRAFLFLEDTMSEGPTGEAGKYMNSEKWRPPYSIKEMGGEDVKGG
jgi:hypothetical protein